MSTKLKTFKGLVENPHPHTQISSYISKEIFLTRFYGGQKRGASIQITIDESYVQLDNKTAKEFAKEILQALQEL